MNSYSNQEYTKSINYNSSEIIINCKPMINSTASKTFMKEYSISKRYQEDKLSLFPSIVETEIIPEKENPKETEKEIEKEKSISDKSETEKDEDENNDIDLDFKSLLIYQENNLPVPISKKNNETFKILKIQEMKRLSMPPYKSVKKYEPRIALKGGITGIKFYKTIISKAHKYLKTDGYLVLEIGYNQAKKIKKIAEKTKRYRNIEVIKDYNNLDRIVIMQRN